jgi:putative Holliday junction resolvase
MSFDQYPNYQKFIGETILCLDYGTKFTGLALFSPGRDPFPLPHSRLKFINQTTLIKELKKVIEDEVVTVVVVGIPRFTDGKESSMSEKVHLFVSDLKKEISCQVFKQDETLSTFEAEERMRNSPRYNFKVDYNQIDALSASIILEDFLRSPIIEE